MGKRVEKAARKRDIHMVNKAYKTNEKISTCKTSQHDYSSEKWK